MIKYPTKHFIGIFLIYEYLSFVDIDGVWFMQSVVQSVCLWVGHIISYAKLIIINSIKQQPYI